MKNLMSFTTLTFTLFMLFTACEKESIEPSCEEQINSLKINQLQILGSHNSYRKRTYEPIFQMLQTPPVDLPDGFSPEDWDYDHVPITKQFEDFGIRSIELDIFYDPEGGLFSNRMGNAFVGESPASGEPALDVPGLKMLHYPDFDYLSHHLTFKDALQTVKDWSDSKPNHLPLIILVEPKEDNPNAMLPGMGLTETIPFDKTALESIDQEIKDIFGESLERVITPNDVLGSYSTLNEAILSDNWPTLGESRGKVLFVMLATGDEGNDYLEGHPSLMGRTMFVFAEEGADHAAFIKIDNPRETVGRIQDLVQKGYMVRTRADADTKEARSGDSSRRTAAFESGAQIISTDYYQPDSRSETSALWTDYFVELPGGKLALPNSIFDLPVFDCDIQE